MRAFRELPPGYEEAERINLQSDKKLALLVNGLGGALVVLLILVGHFFLMPMTEFLSGLVESDSLAGALAPLMVMLAGALLYIVLHELTHAAVMKACGGGHVRFGFTGLYAYAGSEEDFFDRGAYIAISLAPLVVWGVIFTALLLLLPRDWFWVAWFWQICNVSGAAGDIFVACRTARRPRTLLTRDTGIEMTGYLPRRGATDREM